MQLKSGAGFIFDEAGHIVTANHVLAGANNVSVIFKDGDRYDAFVVGRDAFTDTAVLKLVGGNSTADKNIIRSTKPVTLGNSSALKIGDRAVTTGYPFASKIALTAGVIGRTDYLLYFPATGIIGSTLTVDLAKQFNEIPDDLEGVLVDTIVRGDSADIAGIDAASTNKYGERQSGDVIIALDGNSIVDIEGLLSYVQKDKTIGENIVFTVYRGGQYLNLNAPLQHIK
jgi:S1-C subfamily serine protease